MGPQNQRRENDQPEVDLLQDHQDIVLQDIPALQEPLQPARNLLQHLDGVFEANAPVTAELKAQ